MQLLAGTIKLSAIEPLQFAWVRADFPNRYLLLKSTAMHQQDTNERLSQELYSLKNADLQDILGQLYLAKSGRKSQLVSRLIEYASQSTENRSRIANIVGLSSTSTGYFGQRPRETSNPYNRGGYPGVVMPIGHETGYPSYYGMNSQNFSGGYFSHQNQPSSNLYGINIPRNQPISIQNNINISINNGGEGSWSQKAKEMANKYLDKVIRNDLFYAQVAELIKIAKFEMPNFNLRFYIPNDLFKQIRGSKKLKVLFYSVELNNAALTDNIVHKWPAKSSLRLNQSSVRITKKFFDPNSKKPNSVRERPGDLTLHVGTSNTLFLTAEPDTKQGDWPYAVRIVVSEEISLEKIMDKIATLDIKSTEKLIDKLNKPGIEGVEAASKLPLSLIDPLTLCPIEQPARGVDCSHIDCFDLKTFITFQKEGKNAKWDCVLCAKGPLTLDTIVKDDWVKSVIECAKKKYPDAERVEIDKEHNWAIVKEDESDIDSFDENQEFQEPPPPPPPASLKPGSQNVATDNTVYEVLDHGQRPAVNFDNTDIPQYGTEYGSSSPQQLPIQQDSLISTPPIWVSSLQDRIDSTNNGLAGLLSGALTAQDPYRGLPLDLRRHSNRSTFSGVADLGSYNPSTYAAGGDLQASLDFLPSSSTGTNVAANIQGDKRKVNQSDDLHQGPKHKEPRLT
eukprot:augustus_masked-scaffold_12-processed-gene-5.5-mRNA-1 protein AED:1.00 eAED:1.00 QI:0/-1/0/0/-1/1/1/0/676